MFRVFSQFPKLLAVVEKFDLSNIISAQMRSISNNILNLEKFLRTDKNENYKQHLIFYSHLESICLWDNEEDLERTDALNMGELQLKV